MVEIFRQLYFKINLHHLITVLIYFSRNINLNNLKDNRDLANSLIRIIASLMRALVSMNDIPNHKPMSPPMFERKPTNDYFFSDL